MRKKRLLNQKRHTHKIIRNKKTTDQTRTIALTPKEVVATAHTLQTAVIPEVTVTLELFALKHNLTGLTRCMTDCSHAIFRTNQVSEPKKWGSK